MGLGFGFGKGFGFGFGFGVGFGLGLGLGFVRREPRRRVHVAPGLGLGQLERQARGARRARLPAQRVQLDAQPRRTCRCVEMVARVEMARVEMARVLAGQPTATYSNLPLHYPLLEHH